MQWVADQCIEAQLVADPLVQASVQSKRFIGLEQTEMLNSTVHRLIFSSWEWLRGEPVSERVQGIGVQIGLMLVVGLFGVGAFFVCISGVVYFFNQTGSKTLLF